MNLVLLGDSILDNGAYVSRGGAVAEILQQRVGAAGRVSLLAQDGAVIADVVDQLARLPSDGSHLLISAGGNDALRNTGVLLERASSVAQALGKIEPIRDGFALAYRELLDAAQACRLPVILCTIYDVRLPDAMQRRVANLALGVLNDVITRAAVRRKWPVIDLRVLFNDPGDYANAIEPSALGAEKIAVTAIEILEAHNFAGPASFYG